ncbi:UvrD-helicase domain-containing protein [Rothia sp. ND6WE1A]|uniref:UvrD-helicase domain-containing protein n=1 Tax=Rothia sp. ND6WE1A TaxID=1848190 RepID=UPI00082DFA07|nr:UvrD-helicase domain-containing protein [Rothia sp. ND6WE1A]
MNTFESKTINLTEEQGAFVSAPESRIVLVAPAGTGKTEVIAERAKHVLARGDRVLCTTFTRKARAVIENRLTGAGIVDTEVRTITSLAVQLVLERYPALAVGDGSEVARRITQRTPVSTKELLRYETLLACGAPMDTDTLVPEVEPLFDRYTELKRMVGYISYVDALVLAPALAQPAEYTEVIVDEAQDLSPLHWQFIKALAPERIVLAGDPDQSIYGFNGIDAQLLPTLCSQGFKEYVLTKSWRTPVAHLEAVNAHRTNPVSSTKTEGTLTRVSTPTTADAIAYINANARPGDAVLGLTSKRLNTFRVAYEKAHPGVVTTASAEGNLDPQTLMFSTVHAFKGNEAYRVFVLDVRGSDLTGWGMNGDTESHNLHYVACSRALKDLFLLDKGEQNDNTDNTD